MFEVFELDKTERDRRYKMVRAAMKKKGLGALVVYGFAGFDSSEGANFVYLTNISTFNCLALPGYLVFPADGEPTMIGFARFPGDKMWVSDIRGKGASYSKAIVDRLKELRLDNGTIGVITTKVVGVGSTGERGFPYVTYKYLQDNLPGARLEDATDIIDVARRIKSQAEIHCLELGCAGADATCQAVVDTARPGVRDYEVLAEAIRALMLHGCEPDTLFIYGSGKDYVDTGNGQFLNPGFRRALEAGDMIHTEFNGKYNNYCAQFNQPFAVGEPDREWLKVFKTAEACVASGLKALKPGITIRDLAQALTAPIADAGLKSLRPCCHGLGLTSEEPLGMPGGTCIPSDSFLIEENMVFEFEPHIVTPDMKKGLTLGYPVLVTKTGCRSLYKGKVGVRMCS